MSGNVKKYNMSKNVKNVKECPKMSKEDALLYTTRNLLKSHSAIFLVTGSAVSLIEIKTPL